MGIGKRIKEARERRGLTQKELGELCGVTGSAITNYENETSHPKEPVMYKLMEALNVDANFLFQDVTHITSKRNDVTLAEYEHIEKYRALDGHGKKMVDIVLDEETSRMQAEAEQIEAAQEPVLPQTKVIPLLGASFAAGPGEPDFGNLWTNYEVSADNKAEFAIKITGDSMEPYLQDGKIAFGLKRNPSDGDVGAFLLDGEFLCKQYCIDMDGNVYLFSLNRNRADSDKTIMRNGDRTLLCFGTIILDERPPLPGR